MHKQISIILSILVIVFSFGFLSESWARGYGHAHPHPRTRSSSKAHSPAHFPHSPTHNHHYKVKTNHFAKITPIFVPLLAIHRNEVPKSKGLDSNSSIAAEVEVGSRVINKFQVQGQRIVEVISNQVLWKVENNNENSVFIKPHDAIGKIIEIKLILDTGRAYLLKLKLTDNSSRSIIFVPSTRDSVLAKTTNAYKAQEDKNKLKPTSLD